MLESFQSSIDAFIQTESPLPKVIVIYGPTACGKTRLSIEIAQYLNTEIISADSRQIYKYMDIGTGKVTEEEMQWVPHHMLNVIDPSQVFSMVDFAKMWVPIIDGLHRQKKIPIICGGTGLYIDGLLYEMDYPDTPPDWKYREDLEKIRAEQGNEALWKMLEAVDPEYAHELLPNNYRYVMRGLEVFHATGKSKWKSKNTKKLRYSPLFITPYSDENRAKLYETIDARVLWFFKNWLTNEIEYIISVYTSLCPGLTTIGYREILDFMEWRTTLEESIALVQQHSRNYAKRQITWNKKYDNFNTGYISSGGE